MMLLSVFEIATEDHGALPRDVTADQDVARSVDTYTEPPLAHVIMPDPLAVSATEV
jgi:hypothetical protein